MRVAGINVAAVLVAALAFYGLGYVIYYMLIDQDAWNAAKHIDASRLGRMPFGGVLPLMTAMGLAVVFKWGDVQGLGEGVKWAIGIALASAIPALWYNWFYGSAPIWTFLIDSGNQLLGHAVAGAVLARWR